MAEIQHVLVEQLKNKDDIRSNFLKTAIIASHKAGKVIANVIKDQKVVLTKSSVADLVTETDQRVEKLIYDILHNEFPKHCFIGEESEHALEKLTDQPTWIVDPIDGTCNFVHTNDNVAVSIALVINKQTEVGVVFVPMLGDLYVAVRGEGSYLNANQLRINSPAKELSNALIATEWGASRVSENLNTCSENMRRVINQVHGIRCTGSAAINMCLVGCSAVDLYYEYGPHCWDVAAASLLVTEAGGHVASTTGKEFDMMSRRFIAASSIALIEQLLPLLVDIPYESDPF